MDNVINVEAIVGRIKEVKGFKSDRQVADFLGVSKGTVSNWMTRNSIDFPLVINKLPEVDLNWLLTGRGTPIHRPNHVSSELAEGETSFMPYRRDAAAANLRTIFDNKHQFVLGRIVIPNIPTCDGAVYVSGDSMYPLLKSGDIVGYKEIHSLESIIYGERYLVAFDLDGDEYLTVKYINRSDREDCIKLVSYNQYHSPQDIPVKSVTALAIVKFSIRRNMML